MAQQINLYTPRLLKPQRIFSAQTISGSLAGLAVLLLLFCGGVLVLQNLRKTEYQALSQRQTTERGQLTTALQSLRQRSDPAVLTQQLQAAKQDLARLQQQQALVGRWQLPADQHHSTMLQLLASSTPAPVWLTALELAPDHLTLHGMTLDPGVLPAWVANLQAQPALAGRLLSSVQVEQPGLITERSGPAALPAPAANALALNPRTPVWAFRLATAAPTGSAPETSP
jgi:Tfp pilus assembly protein PilN